MLPKIHKKGNPGRPIVTTPGVPIANLSSFIDVHLQLALHTVPSYLRDTTNFISKLNDLVLPPWYILATMDVSPLYINIPTNDGVLAAGLALETKAFSTPVTQLLHFLKLVLTNNEFEFDGKFYHQIKV